MGLHDVPDLHPEPARVGLQAPRRGAGSALQGEEGEGGLREGGRAHAVPPEPGGVGQALPEAEPRLAQGGGRAVRDAWRSTTSWRTSGRTWGRGRWKGSRTSSGRATRRWTPTRARPCSLSRRWRGRSTASGSRFEELRLILDGVKDSERMGVCLDTCHVFAAGFDLSSKPAVERTMGLFADVVGKERLKVVHLNDSMGPAGERARQARIRRQGADRGEGVSRIPPLRGRREASPHNGGAGGREDAVRRELEDGKAPPRGLAQEVPTFGTGAATPARQPARSSSTARPRRTSSAVTLSRASPSRARRSRTTPCRSSGRCSSSSRC